MEKAWTLFRALGSETSKSLPNGQAYARSELDHGRLGSLVVTDAQSGMHRRIFDPMIASDGLIAPRPIIKGWLIAPQSSIVEKR